MKMKASGLIEMLASYVERNGRDVEVCFYFEEKGFPLEEMPMLNLTLSEVQLLPSRVDWSFRLDRASTREDVILALRDAFPKESRITFILTEKRARLTLEALKALATEGVPLGDYDSDATSDDALELGRELCLALSIPLEGRDWLKG